ncbi:hypothetical protein V7024_17615 [Bacillus sp. JJ864]|uniref:hypothetical protein n=1 Tax=Bacillus sp. JJ864 TaxID=3122975 RepID=UPI0030008F5E
MKKALTTVLALGITLGGLPTISSAAMEKTSVTQEQQQQQVLSEELIKEIKKNFTRGGIPEETQVKLTEKVNRGELLDAQNPAMAGTGRTESKSYWDENGILCTERKTTYLDGSVTLESASGGTVERVKSTDKQETVSGGTSRTGSGYVSYYGRNVSRLSGVVYSSFKADYTNVQGGYDSLSRIYEWDISGVGSLSNVYLDLVRDSETYDSNAYGYLRFTGTVGGYTTTFYHRLYVGNDTAWDNGNW